MYKKHDFINKRLHFDVQNCLSLTQSPMRKKKKKKKKKRKEVACIVILPLIWDLMIDGSDR